MRLLKGKLALLYCFGSVVLVQSTSRPPSPPSSKPHKDAYRIHYADDAKRISNKYTNAQLLKLGWRYDPTNELSKEQLQKIESPLIRCKTSHPDAHRQLRMGGRRPWTNAPESNADFVDSAGKRRKVKDRQRAEQDKKRRQDIFEKTGVRPLTHQTKLRVARLERARQAAPDGVFTVLKTGHNTHELMTDPRSRTNSQYIAQERARVKRYNDNARDRKRMNRPTHSSTPLASPQDPRAEAPSPAAPPRTPSSGRGDHRFESWWSDLPDLR